MNELSNGNRRTRFLFDALPVRGVHVRLCEVWRHIAARKAYPPAVARLLGEMLAAAALLSDNAKTAGTLIVQVQGKGALRMLVAEAAAGQVVRATARWDEQADIAADAGLRDLLGADGIFAITFQPEQGEAWQGIVPLEGGSVAEMLMAYMQRSQQIQTFIALAADGDAAGGLLLQRLPEAEADEEAWFQAAAPAQTVSAAELCGLEAEALLYRLFHEQPPRVFPADTLEFACTCSRGKVADMLKLLGEDEAAATLAAEGSITANCDFCHEIYAFDEAEVCALFGKSSLLHLRGAVVRQ